MDWIVEVMRQGDRWLNGESMEEDGFIVIDIGRFVYCDVYCYDERIMK